MFDIFQPGFGNKWLNLAGNVLFVLALWHFGRKFLGGGCGGGCGGAKKQAPAAGGTIAQQRAAAAAMAGADA